MRLRAAVLVVFLASLGACGDEAPVPSGNIVTAKERYIRQADALCQDFRDASMGAALAYRGAGAKQRAKIRSRLADRGEEVQDRLEALPRPDADRELLERFLEGLREQVEALRKGSEARVPQLQELADRYGFDACGQGGG